METKGHGLNLQVKEKAIETELKSKGMLLTKDRTQWSKAIFREGLSFMGKEKGMKKLDWQIPKKRLEISLEKEGFVQWTQSIRKSGRTKEGLHPLSRAMGDSAKEASSPALHWKPPPQLALTVERLPGLTEMWSSWETPANKILVRIRATYGLLALPWGNLWGGIWGISLNLKE